VLAEGSRRQVSERSETPKRWLDEQELHTRRSYWVRRPISSKPDTCTESTDVNAAGISVKVACLTLGDLSIGLVLRVP